jgi:hypothetical protein
MDILTLSIDPNLKLDMWVTNTARRDPLAYIYGYDMLADLSFMGLEGVLSFSHANFPTREKMGGGVETPAEIPVTFTNPLSVNVYVEAADKSLVDLIKPPPHEKVFHLWLEPRSPDCWRTITEKSSRTTIKPGESKTISIVMDKQYNLQKAIF